MSTIRDIKLYGGPEHGRYVRLDVSETQFLNVSVYRPPEITKYVDQFVRPPLPELITYQIDYRADQRMRPKRYRRIWFGVPASERLQIEARRELEYDLEHGLHRLPWEFPESSLLSEFEEWFASHWFANTGQLTWQGSPAIDY